MSSGYRLIEGGLKVTVRVQRLAISLSHVEALAVCVHAYVCTLWRIGWEGVGGWGGGGRGSRVGMPTAIDHLCIVFLFVVDSFLKSVSTDPAGQSEALQMEKGYCSWEGA